MKSILVCTMALLGLWACGKDAQDGRVRSAVAVAAQEDPKEAFKAYWYQGKAEISRFALSQNRYRDTHDGEAILIFVTEDFLTDKQVKNDFYKNPNSVPILKLNAIHRFVTGIYDYSVMSSVFSPVQQERFPYPLKVTNSSQDWCGQTFMQVNSLKKGFRFRWNSYFEQEADADKSLAAAFLEDGIWTQLRIDPSSLPSGRVAMYPSLAYFRLMHIEVKPYPADVALLDYAGGEFPGEQLQVFRIVYPELQRTLEIVFERQAPYRIAGWKDTYPSLSDKQMRSTVAKRTHDALSSYWKFNGVGDQGLREALGIEGF